MTPKVLVYDVETSPMQVYTFSLYKPFIAINQIIEPTRVICWAARWHGEKEVIFRSEYHHGRDAMLRKLYDLMCEADIIVHFNGDSFDDRQVRREFKQAGFPPLPPLKTVDLYKVAKKLYYFPSNKLDYIVRALGIGAKVGHSGFQLWIDCLTPSPEDDPNRQKRAWALMRKYCKGDVVVEDDLYTDLLPWIPNHPHSSLFVDDPEREACWNCGAEGFDNKDNFQRRGFSYKKAGKYRRYQCKHCAAWNEGKKAVAFTGSKQAS